ncbi:MAG TPA: hypothetical protein VEW45_04215 [Candidatus Dormibacteraeota bacterium]|nr:hypothetical protein [Candidatus Dormibacteraeota bacterium]
MKTLKTFGLAGGLVAAALVGGTLINAVAASPASPSGTPSGVDAQDVDAAAYCQAWKEAFASELGVSVDDLGPAAKAATIATIDAAVASGDLPEDIAARMKEGVENADADGCRLLGAGFHAWGRHAARADFRFDWLTAASGTLGMELADLRTALRAGDSLQEIAEAQSVEYALVSQAIVDAAKADLDALVEAGRITQERADERLAKLTEALAAGEFPRGHRWQRGEAPASPTS